MGSDGFEPLKPSLTSRRCLVSDFLAVVEKAMLANRPARPSTPLLMRILVSSRTAYRRQAELHRTAAEAESRLVTLEGEEGNPV